MKRDPKRLQRILRIRQLQEEAARGRWMQAQIVAREADAQVVQSEQNILNGHEFVREQQSAGSVQGVLHANSAMEHLHNALARTRSTAAVRHTEVAAAKEPWIETRKSARGMEKLHDRAKEEQRVERIQKEDQALESSLETLLTRQKSQTDPAA